MFMLITSIFATLVAILMLFGTALYVQIKITKKGIEYASFGYVL